MLKVIISMLVGVALGVAIADHKPDLADQVRNATDKVQAEVGDQIKELSR